MAERIKSAPDTDVARMAGSRVVLRNLVADEMGLKLFDGFGPTYGHRVLDTNWD